MIRCFNSLHPLYHVLVLGSMCSFIHVFLSYGRMSCAYLISLCILHAFHLMVPFMASILYFSFSRAMNSIYRVHSSIVVQNNVHHYKEFKNLYAQFEGEFILYVVIMRLTCLQVYFFLSLMKCFGSLPKGMPMSSSLQVIHV